MRLGQNLLQQGAGGGGGDLTQGVVAVAHDANPNVTAYPWDDTTGFGTKYADPSTLPPNTGRGAAFSPSGGALVIAHLGSPYVTAYPWDDTTGFGTKYANPSTLPTGAPSFGGPTVTFKALTP